MKNFLTSKKKIIENIFIVISIIISAMCIFSVIIASGYSVLAADDFGHAHRIGFESKNLWEYFLTSLEFSKDIYMTWQGTYFSMFIQALLSPVNNYGMPQLKIVMLGNSILFFIALFFLIWALFKSFNIRNDVKWMLFIYTCLVYIVTAYDDYRELFYWFSGATSYTFPLSLLFIAIGSFLLYQLKKENKYFVIAAIVGFIAMGGTLMVSGMGCYICLLICLYMVLKERKIDKHNMILLGTWISGALLNTVAPGNFTRHAGIDSTGCHPLFALRIACEKYTTHINRYIVDTDFIGVLGIILLVGFAFGKVYKIDWKYIIIGVLGLFLPIVTAFPAALGYSGGMFPDRCRFMVDIAIVLSFVNIVFCLGNCIRVLWNNRMVIAALNIVIVLGIIWLFSTDNYKVWNSMFLKHWDAIVNGTYKEYQISCEKLYNSLENREGEDVVIRKEDVPEMIANFGTFEIYSDPNHYLNYGMSQCYGLSSLTVVSDEESVE